MTTDKNIGARLKVARKKAGFGSAKFFASSLNIPYVTYTQYEAGSRRISTNTLLKYSKLLNVSASWLLTGEEDEQTLEEDRSTSVNVMLRKKCDIDANFFADIYIEISEALKVSKVTLTERDKILVTVELYSALVVNNNPNLLKQNILQAIIQSFDKLSVSKIA